MRIDFFLGSILAAFALNSLYAQENKTAVTPVENINLNGVNVPLNIKTLAEIQRFQEEQAMKEQLQTALKAGKPQAVAPATAVANKPAAATPVRSVSKEVQTISANTLLGVYGTTGSMTAEIQTVDKRVRTVREGEQIGKFNIKRISQNGLELVTGNGNTQQVSVGAQVRF
jgi:hypothetical protein